MLMSLGKVVAVKTSVVRVKNNGERHHWQFMGRGELVELGEINVECSVCHERRSVLVSVSEMNRDVWGCWRRGGLPYRSGDLVVAEGRLDTFDQMMPDGLALTHNTGHNHFVSLDNMRPF